MELDQNSSIVQKVNELGERLFSSTSLEGRDLIRQHLRSEFCYKMTVFIVTIISLNFYRLYFKVIN